MELLVHNFVAIHIYSTQFHVYQRGDVVRVIDDLAKIYQFQGLEAWNDDMALVCDTVMSRSLQFLMHVCILYNFLYHILLSFV